MQANLEPAREVARVISDSVVDSAAQIATRVAPQLVQHLLLNLGAALALASVFDMALSATRLGKRPKGFGYYSLLLSAACFLTAAVNRWIVT